MFQLLLVVVRKGEKHFSHIRDREYDTCLRLSPITTTATTKTRQKYRQSPRHIDPHCLTLKILLQIENSSQSRILGCQECEAMRW